MVQALRAAAKDKPGPGGRRSTSTSSPAAARPRLSEVGEALDEVRKAGKPVLAYATAYDDDSYQLAAHASESLAEPDRRRWWSPARAAPSSSTRG